MMSAAVFQEVLRKCIYVFRGGANDWANVNQNFNIKN